MEIQLEFNVENKSREELAADLVLKQFAELHNSMGKVRRKLFAELGEMKKHFAIIQMENEELKSMLKEFTHGKTQWTYAQNDCLFDVSKHQELAG